MLLNMTFTVLFPELQHSVAWLKRDNVKHRVVKKAERKQGTIRSLKATPSKKFNLLRSS